MNFNDPYNRADFIIFLKQFLPDFEDQNEEVAINRKSKYLQIAYKIGCSKSLNLNIYEIEHNSENDPRVSISIESFSFLQDYSVTRALVIFRNNKTNNYRLSLITFQTSWDEGNKVKVNPPNPRRYSFYLGPEAKVNTPKIFLKNTVTDIDDLLKRFDVEIVTKEFFKQYKKLFDDLTAYLRKDKQFLNFTNLYGVDIPNYAKKLLGQIVFLYFLQRKGWLGAKKGESIANGDKEFLRSLFNKSQTEKKNFYNHYLEHLFYNALNRQPEKSFSYYRDYFDCQIPFLNGGLFEPLPHYGWDKEMLHLPDSLFSNLEKSGILDIFDQYNFTIDESDANDQEVSVDPEMLGKIFENLLDENLRKGKGTYYTPREIVHYMCKESLVNYLKAKFSHIESNTIKRIFSFYENNDDPHLIIIDPKILSEIAIALSEIKIVDPACGSGAFLVGMLQQITKARMFIDWALMNPNSSEYSLKKETIQKSIYGVDIDPGAVDIAKLRLWLSLVVDHDLEEIEPLPNLDYKIMQGNSLLENLVIGGKTIPLKYDNKIKTDNRTKDMKNLFEEENQLKMFVDKSEKLIDELSLLHTQYFNIHDSDKKKILKKKIDSREDELIQSKCEEEVAILDEQIRNKPTDNKLVTNNTLLIFTIKDTLKKWQKDHIRPFFPWRLHFGEVFKGDRFGFDIVIANPPYIKEYVDRHAFDGLRHSQYYQGKMDLWYLFACKGIDLAKEQTGILCLIAQNNWVTSYGASIMRNKVVNDTKILQLVDFGDYKIFDAGIQTMIMLFLKNNQDNMEYSFDYRGLVGNSFDKDILTQILNLQKKYYIEYLKPQIIKKDYINQKLTFGNTDAVDILDKISAKANLKLDKKTEIAQGIVYPQDKIIKSTNHLLKNSFNIGDGIFIISNDEKNRYNFNEIEKAIIKPSYSAKEIFRFGANTINSEWVIYTNSSFKDISKLDKYPNIKKHLDQFLNVITSDNKPYGLHRARDESFFKGEKIVSFRKCIRPTFSYIDFDSYVSATFYVIKTPRINLKYLTGLLNSKLIAYWLKHKGKMQGINYQIDKEPLLEIPIFKSSQDKQDQIIALVDQILNIISKPDYDPKQPPQKQIELEKQIDQMVYKIYDLTDDEIRVVEDKMK